MNAIASVATGTVASPASLVPASITPPFIDPLDNDDAADDVVVTTRRAIMRVALVAAETAGRFQREAVPHDPMTWMLAPRAAFDGAAAVDACLERDACMRGILIHGLGLGLDVDRAALDTLLSEDDARDVGPVRPAGGPGRRRRTDRQTVDLDAVPRNREKEARSERRLYTATVIASHGEQTLLGFHASVAAGEDEIRERIARRLNPVLASMAEIHAGFRPGSAAMVAAFPTELTDMVRDMEANPSVYADADITVDVRQIVGGRSVPAVFDRSN